MKPMDIIKPSEETLTVAFAQLCRTCLCEGEMCNISEIYIAGKNSSELLSLYASVQIEPNDDLPQRMCLNCIDELMRVDLFVKKCKVSDRTLRDIKTEVKTEPHDLCDVEPEFVVCEQPNLRDFETDPENCDIGVELSADDQQSTLGDIKTEPEDGCIVGLEFVACDQLNTNVPSGNTCSFCSETFGSSIELRSHRLETKHFKVYKCDFCEEIFSTNSAMLKHMKVHVEENSNASETCEKDSKCEYESGSSGPSTEKKLHTEIVHRECVTIHSIEDLKRNEIQSTDNELQRLNRGPKTSTERVRDFRARKRLLKKSGDNQVRGPSEIRTIQKRTKSKESTRRWRQKKKGGSSKKQAKTAAQRMREYRQRKKLAKKMLLKQISEQDLDTTVSTAYQQEQGIYNHSNKS